MVQFGAFLAVLLLIVGSVSSCHDGSDRKKPDTTPLTQQKANPGEVKAPDQRPVPGAFSLEDLPGDGATVANLKTLVEDLRLNRVLRHRNANERLKIAILDNGFTSLNDSIGKTLPADSQLIKGPLGAMTDTTHGTKIGEVVYGIARGSQDLDENDPGPQMFFLNTNGYSNLSAAIAKVIELQVDMVVYAQIWEYGGNLDGNGFINDLVNQVTSAGILWLNAAGNFGKASFTGKISVNAGDLTVRLPYRDRFVRLQVRADQVPVKIVLGWNDFADDTGYRSPQDLDLVVLDGDGKEVAASRLLQSGGIGDNPDKRYSAHAREIVRTTLNAGTYYLQVPVKSANFDAESRLHISVDGYGVQIPETSTEGVVLIPADNPEVLTVGASDVDYSSRRLSQGKPEVEVPSTLLFSTGVTIDGTSAAVAVAAGAFAAYMQAYGKQSRSDLVDLIQTGTIAQKPNAHSPPVLQFP